MWPVGPRRHPAWRFKHWQPLGCRSSLWPCSSPIFAHLLSSVVERGHFFARRFRLALRQIGFQAGGLACSCNSCSVGLQRLARGICVACALLFLWPYAHTNSPHCPRRFPCRGWQFTDELIMKFGGMAAGVVRLVPFCNTGGWFELRDVIGTRPKGRSNGAMGWHPG